jgi:hypothetical protein
MAMNRLFPAKSHAVFPSHGDCMEWEYEFADELVKSRPKHCQNRQIGYYRSCPLWLFLICALYHVVICCSMRFVLPVHALYHSNMMLHFWFYIYAHTMTHPGSVSAGSTVCLMPHDQIHSISMWRKNSVRFRREQTVHCHYAQWLCVCCCLPLSDSLNTSVCIWFSRRNGHSWQW